MHEPIRDSLEEYLNGCREKIPQEFHAHLRACEGCASELKLLEMHSGMLRALRHGEELEPRAGFYARGMDRIEDQSRSSIWSVFLEPRFGRRLAVASAALILLLATYLVTTEPGGPDIALAPGTAVVVSGAPSSDVTIAQDTPEQQQQRDAILVDLASYHE
jgi:hypothetical protein